MRRGKHRRTSSFDDSPSKDFHLSTPPRRKRSNSIDSPVDDKYKNNVSGRSNFSNISNFSSVSNRSSRSTHGNKKKRKNFIQNQRKRRNKAKNLKKEKQDRMKKANERSNKLSKYMSKYGSRMKGGDVVKTIKKRMETWIHGEIVRDRYRREEIAAERIKNWYFKMLPVSREFRIYWESVKDQEFESPVKQISIKGNESNLHLRPEKLKRKNSSHVSMKDDLMNTPENRIIRMREEFKRKYSPSPSLSTISNASSVVVGTSPYSINKRKSVPQFQLLEDIEELEMAGEQSPEEEEENRKEKIEVKKIPIVGGMKFENRTSDGLTHNDSDYFKNLDYDHTTVDHQSPGDDYIGDILDDLEEETERIKEEKNARLEAVRKVNTHDVSRGTKFVKKDIESLRDLMNSSSASAKKIVKRGDYETSFLGNSLLLNNSKIVEEGRSRKSDSVVKYEAEEGKTDVSRNRSKVNNSKNLSVSKSARKNFKNISNNKNISSGRVGRSGKSVNLRKSAIVKKRITKKKPKKVVVVKKTVVTKESKECCAIL